MYIVCEKYALNMQLSIAKFYIKNNFYIIICHNKIFDS